LDYPPRVKEKIRGLNLEKFMGVFLEYVGIPRRKFFQEWIGKLPRDWFLVLYLVLCIHAEWTRGFSIGNTTILRRKNSDLNLLWKLVKGLARNVLGIFRVWAILPKTVWPKNVWPKITLSKWSFDRNVIWPKIIWPKALSNESYSTKLKFWKNIQGVKIAFFLIKSTKQTIK
jgi:hypothetical protein